MSAPHYNDPVPLEEIKRLHEMGFILVPLTGDGKTPNTYGILTEDEINTSRQESEDGEEHPISSCHFIKRVIEIALF